MNYRHSGKHQEELEQLIQKRTEELETKLIELKQVQIIVQAQRDLAVLFRNPVSDDETWSSAFDILLNASGLDCGGLYFFDKCRDILELVYHKGLSDNYVSQISHFTSDSPNVSLVLKKQNLIRTAAELQVNKFYSDEGLFSAIILPIINQEQVLGCINLASHTMPEISHEAIKTLESLAMEVGNLILYRRSQEELRNSEARLKALFNAVPDMMFRVDRAGIFLDYKADIKELYEQNVSIIGKRYRDITPPDFADLIDEKINETLDCKKPITFEYRLSVPGAGILDYEARMTPSGPDDVITFVHNITERKKTDKKLQESEKQYSTMFHKSNIPAVVMKLPEIIITEANEAAEKLIGFKREELVGKTTYELGIISQKQRSNLVEIFGREGFLSDNEMRIVTKSGADRIVIINTTPIEIKGEPCVFCSIKDITEENKAKERLRTSERTLKFFVDNAPAAIALFDRNMNYLTVSRRFIKDNNLDNKDIIGHSHYEVFPEIPERWRKIHKRCLEGVTDRAEEDPFLRSDGTLDWICWEIYPWYEKDDEIGGVILFTERITERKLIQDRLKQNEESFKVLFEQNAVPMWVYDQETLAFLAVNDAATEHYGYSRPEFLDMTIADIRPAEDLERLKESVNVRTADYQITGPWHHIKKDRTQILVQIASHKITWFNKPAVIVVSLDQTSQIKAEEARAASESRFSEIAQNIREVFWIFSHAEEKIIYISPAYELVWGRKAESLYSEPRSYIESIHTVDRTEMLKSLEKQALGQLTTIEYRIVRPDGSIRWIWDRSTPIFENGILIRSVGVASDITDRKLAEEKLYASEEKYRGLIESLDNVIAMVDENGKFLFMNKIAADQLGKPAELITGRRMHELFPSHVADRQLANVQTSIREDRIITHENISSVDGKPVWYKTTILPIHDAEGKAIYAIINSTDINKLKQAQQELTDLNTSLEDKVRERTAQVQDLYDNAPVGYHSLDASGNLLTINKTELDWLGYSIEEMIGKHVSSVYMLDSIEAFNNAFSDLKRTGKSERVELYVLRKDGSTFPAEINATAIYDNEGNFISSRSTLHDITERKKAEDKMNKALCDAEMANRSKSEFLANMSHEIRTPMNAILGYSELLGSLIKNSFEKEYLESIKASGKTLLTLLNDILDLSKIEAGKLELEFGYIQTTPFFAEFEKIFAFRTKEKAISFITEISEDTPPFLYIDETRLRQVVLNLAGNGVKFTDRGYIKLKVWCENNRIISNSDKKEVTDIIITIEDTGIGIPRENLYDIFDPFMQVRNKLAKGGTGLGLTISKRLAGLMNGNITVSSTEGIGSIFTLAIKEVPFLTSYELSAGEPAINPESIVFEKALVLVVDDMESNRKFFRDALKNTALDVIEAVSGGSALEIIKNRRPDLIISDIRMPEMDGFELLEAIKSDKKLESIPVVAYTASVMKEQKSRINSAGFAGLLVKPVRITDLYSQLINNLRYHIKESGDDNLKAEKPLTKSEITDIEGLISSLEGTYLEKAKTLERRQPIGEVKLFGESLKELGEKHKSHEVSEYGQNLLSAADTFDINRLLKLITGYHDLIKSLNS